MAKEISSKIGKMKEQTQQPVTAPIQKVVSAENQEPKKRGPKSTMKDKGEIRATFIVRQDYLEKLKDYTFQQKFKNPLYNLKDALNDALEIFFQQAGEIKERDKTLRDANLF